MVVLGVQLDQLGAEVGTHAGEHPRRVARCWPVSTPRRNLVTKTLCT
jgi:hypothetical protein